MLYFNLFIFITGDGKSHYITSEINKLCISSTTIPINESFSAQNCIEKLNAFAEKTKFAIHLNFTLPFLKVRLLELTISFSYDLE